MFKYIFRTQEGRDLLAGVPLVIFFALFIAIGIWLFLISKKQVAKLENLPLEDGTKNNSLGEVGQ